MLWFRPVFFEELLSSQCRQSYHLLVEWDLPLLLSFNRFVRREKQVPLVNVSNCPSCLLNVVHPSLSAAVTPCHPPSVAQAMQTRRNRWASSWAPCTLNTISTNTPTHTHTNTHTPYSTSKLLLCLHCWWKRILCVHQQSWLQHNCLNQWFPNRVIQICSGVLGKILILR